MVESWESHFGRGSSSRTQHVRISGLLRRLPMLSSSDGKPFAFLVTGLFFFVPKNKPR